MLLTKTPIDLLGRTLDVIVSKTARTGLGLPDASITLVFDVFTSTLFRRRRHLLLGALIFLEEFGEPFVNSEILNCLIEKAEFGELLEKGHRGPLIRLELLLSDRDS